MWMDWLARWAVIGGLSLVDAAWLWARGTGFAFGAVDGRLRLAGTCLVFCLGAALLTSRYRLVSAVVAKTSDFFCSATQLLLLVPPAVTLIYLGATLNLPLVDPELQRLDQLFGFDWNAFNFWIAAHQPLSEVFRFAYATMLWQPFIIMFLVSASRAGDANSELIWIFLVSMVMCAAISATMPALGYDGVIGPAHIEALKEIRAGLWTTLDLNKIDGIVTFPSYHAALAVVMPFVLRRIRWAFWMATALNALMLLSTPTVGGHYLADTIAGVLLALISIALTTAIRRSIERKLGQRAEITITAPHQPLSVSSSHA